METIRFTLQGTTERVFPKKHKVCLAGFSETAKTAKEAKAKLSEAVTSQIQNSFVRHYRCSSDGSVWCLSYRGGWAYDIIRPSNARCPSSCGLGQDRTEQEALQMMEDHLRSYNKDAQQTA